MEVVGSLRGRDGRGFPRVVCVSEWKKESGVLVSGNIGL